MAVSKDEAVRRARADLAKRLGVSESEIAEEAIESADFPDMALGAPVEEEMSGQMMTSGWGIKVKSGLSSDAFGAGDDQIRLYNYRGSNHKL